MTMTVAQRSTARLDSRLNGRYWPGVPRRAWAGLAACLLVDPNLFSPGDPEFDPNSVYDADAAKRVCAGCPVRVDCALDALRSREPWGVWGGLDPAERATLRRFPEGAWPQLLGTNSKHLDQMLLKFKRYRQT